MQPYKVIRDTFREAYNLAEEKSPDSSTKVGAIVAVPGGPILYGWNHFLPGFGSDADLERPRKYMLIEHYSAYIKTPPRWTEELKIAAQLFEHSGVEYILLAGEVGDYKNLFNGEYWAP